MEPDDQVALSFISLEKTSKFLLFTDFTILYLCGGFEQILAPVKNNSRAC